MKSRLITIVAIAAGLGLAGMAFRWWTDRSKPPVPIPASGGQALDIRLSTNPHYLQTDPRWAADVIGGSGELIRNVGCTICSAATALTAIGPPTTPDELNDRLKSTGGYTSDGWIIWDAISRSSSSAKVDVIRQPSHRILDASLEAGDFPLVKFWLPGGIPHWVLLVGKDDREYLALDPLSDEPDQTLSSLTDKIYAVRLIRKR